MPDLLLRALEDDGGFRFLVDFAIQHRPGTDFQLRNSKDEPGHATLYYGLTALIHIELTGSHKTRLNVSDTWRGKAGFDPAWKAPRLVDDWRPLQPAVREYLKAAHEVIGAYRGGRYVKKEGATQSALAAETSTWFSAIDREAVVGYESSHERDTFTKELKERYRYGVRPAKGAESWLTKPPPFGNELDVVAVDNEGRVLLIEVKPPAETRAISWAPAQVGYYTEVFRSWRDQVGDPRAAECLNGILAQRVRLGLAKQRQVKTPIEFVPVVAVGEGVRSKATWPGLETVRNLLAKESLCGADARVWLVTEDGGVYDHPDLN